MRFLPVLAVVLATTSLLIWTLHVPIAAHDRSPQMTAGQFTKALAPELVATLRASLTRIAAQQLALQPLARPTPFAFPLMVERFREKLSNESVADRIARMVEQLEKAAGGAVPVGDVERVKGTLAFGKEGGGGAPSGDAAGKARRARKPSRPLPPL